MTDHNNKNILSMRSNNIIQNSNESRRILSAKRKLNFAAAENKENIPKAVRRCRDSISFLDSSILDATYPDKLIQFIRDKRGIRNTAPIFCEPVNTNRDSFPIEIEPIQTNSQKSNENSKNQQNFVEPNQAGIHDSKNRRSQISIRRSSLHSGLAVRVAVKRLTNNIGRRVLVKEFEKTLMGSNFHPEAASTPKQQEELSNDFGSIVSNISCDKVNEPIINETLRPNTPSLPLTTGPSLPRPTELSVRNATISQEKSIFETAMRKNGEEQLIEKRPEQDQTQFFHESIDIGDIGYEKDRQKTLTNKTRNCTTKNHTQPMVETILNGGDITRSQIEINLSHASLSQNSPRIHHPLSTSKPRVELNRLSTLSTHHPSQIVRERSLERHQTAPQSSETIITSARTTPKPHQSDVLSTIIGKIKQSMTSVPPTPKEQRENLGQSIHDASLTIPPTQSQPTPTGPSQTPVVVIPIYTSCDKNHQEKPVEIPQPPAKKDKSQLERKNQTISQLSSPIVITSDNSIESPNMSRRKQRSKRSTRSHKIREELMTSDEDVPNNDQNHRDVFRERNSPENGKNNNRSTLENNQSGVIDLRVRSRRSKKNLSCRGTQKASTSRPIDKQSSAQKSTLVEMDEVQEIDNFLKSINQSYSVEPTKKQLTSRATSTSFRVENNPMEPMIYTSSSSSGEEALFYLDENIIQPLNGLSAKNHGVIYDMSPNSGKKWIDPVIGNKVNGGKNSTMVKRATQVISRNVDPPQVNYKDVMSAMQLSLKNKSIGQSRRKLYSKGVSDNEDPSEQSAEKQNESTKSDISNIKHVSILQKANQNFVQSQRTKNKKHRVHTKLKTIEYRLTDSEKEQSDSSSRKKSALIEDEEHLFKIPRIPAMKSKKSIAPEQFLAKNSISRTSKIQLESNDQSSSSSSSATESSYDSNLSNERRSNRSRKEVEQQTTKALVHTLPKNTTRESNVEIQEREIVNSTFELLETRPKTKQSKRAKSQHKSKNEVPVDPDVTDKIDKNAKRSISSNKKMPANKVSATIESEQSAVEQNNELVSINPSFVDEVVMNTDDAGQTNISVCSTRIVQANEKTAITEKTSTSKKNEQNEKKKNTKANNEKNTKKPKPAKKKNAADNLKVKETDRKKQESVTSAAEGTTIAKDTTSDTNSTDVDSTSSLRRSNRIRRTPIAYWTSKREMDSRDVCYVSSDIVKKRAKKKKPTASTKPPKQLEPIFEQSFDSNISSKELTDNLFDALKEITMNKRPLPETIPEVEESTSDRNSIEAITRSSVVPSTSKRNRIQSKATKSIYTVDHQDIHTDSGLATDSNNEQNPNKKSFILAWLQDLLESKTILSNPELARILNNSDVQVASGSDMIFRDIDGVQYAYYNSSGSDENYGYMRFHPKSSKRKARTKLYEMKLLNLAGVLQLTTEKGTVSLRNGDFATIPKGIHYALANRSNDPSLLFFIKC